jgi:hypothetical protein
MSIWRGSINLNGFIGLLIKSRLWMDALEGVKPVRSERGHSLCRLYPRKAYLIESRLRMDALEEVKPVRSKRGHSLYRLYPLKGSVRGLCALEVNLKPELREI